jgi:hypothetical protein
MGSTWLAKIQLPGKPSCSNCVYLQHLEFFQSATFLKTNSGIKPVFRPSDIELKGVRYGDTGLSATGYCFRKKICWEW